MKHLRLPVLVLLALSFPGCKSDSDDDPIIPGPGPLASGGLDPSFDGDGVVLSDPTSLHDNPVVIAIDGTFLYAAGADTGGPGITPSTRWRVEKRLLSTGELVPAFDTDGVVTHDFLGVEETITGMAIDAGYLYLVGVDTLGGSNSKQWRIEKRDIVTGAMVAAFDGDGMLISEPTTYDDVPNAIAVDAGYLYIVGSDGAGTGAPSDEWRIEKRDKTSGALVASFDGDGVVTSDPSIGFDEARAIAIDATYLYVAGTDFGGAGPANEWRIEKRLLSSGALVAAFDGDGVVTSDPGAGNDRVGSIVIDGSALYVGGTDFLGNGGRMRIEKRDLATGALVTSFDGDGIVSSDPSADIDIINGMALDGGFLYIAAEDGGGSGGNYRWRVEKRDATTGALDASFGTGGVAISNPGPTDDQALSVSVDATSIYVLGLDTTGAAGSNQWRIEKRAR